MTNLPAGMSIVDAHDPDPWPRGSIASAKAAAIHPDIAGMLLDKLEIAVRNLRVKWIVRPHNELEGYVYAVFDYLGYRYVVTMQEGVTTVTKKGRVDMNDIGENVLVEVMDPIPDIREEYEAALQVKECPAWGGW